MAFKNYMNKDQRVEYVTFSTLLGYAKNSFLPKWGNKFLTPEETTKFTEVIAEFQKTAEAVLDRMEGNYRAIIKRDSEDLTVFTLPKEKAVIALDRYRHEKEMVTIERGMLDTICSVSLELCSRCFKTIEEQKDCLLYKCYISASLEIFNDNTEGCPYKIEDVVICNEFLADFIKRLFVELKTRGNVIEVEGYKDSPYRPESSIKAQEGEDTEWKEQAKLLNPI